MTLAGLSALAAARKRRRQRLGQEERRLEVEVHHLVPAAFRKLVEIRAPRRAGIVDEDIELRLALPDLGRQHLDAGHGGNIDRQRDAFAAIVGRKLLRGRLARAGLARGDVDLGRALGEKAGRDHLADAARSARHQRDAALERKQILEHVASVGFADRFGRGRERVKEGAISALMLREAPTGRAKRADDRLRAVSKDKGGPASSRRARERAPPDEAEKCCERWR